MFEDSDFLEIILHDKPRMAFLGDVSTQCKLIVNIDGTGNLYDDNESEDQGKFQHLMMTAAFSTLAIPREDAEFHRRKDINAFLVSERVSASNKAADISRWVRCL